MDLYSLLGLSRTASNADIERAYRRLARRYHPGVNPGDRMALQAYEQIQQAYRVLADADRRRDYDRMGTAPQGAADRESVAFDGFDFSSAAEGPLAATFSELFSDVFQRAALEATAARGADIDLVARVSFVDAMRGVDVALSATREVWCTACGGQGRVAQVPVLCPACRGEGQRRWARGHMVFSRACESCGGAGQQTTRACRPCQGHGRRARTEVVTVRVPAGMESGARLAVPGRGHAGGPGAPAGDLYVHVDVDAHPFFRRHGRDLHITVPLALHEAALGAVVEVPTLDGTVRVRVPAGTEPGRQLRVAGHGVTVGAEPAGDLIVETRIVVPDNLSDRSVQLLREFGQLNDLTAERQAAFGGRSAAPTDDETAHGDRRG